LSPFRARCWPGSQRKDYPGQLRKRTARPILPRVQAGSSGPEPWSEDFTKGPLAVLYKGLSIGETLAGLGNWGIKRKRGKPGQKAGPFGGGDSAQGGICQRRVEKARDLTMGEFSGLCPRVPGPVSRVYIREKKFLGVFLPLPGGLGNLDREGGFQRGPFFPLGNSLARELSRVQRGETHNVREAGLSRILLLSQGGRISGAFFFGATIISPEKKRGEPPGEF